MLQLISGNLGVPAHWSSDLASFVTLMLKFDLKKRIDSFEKFQTHPYMERINMDHVLKRFYHIFIITIKICLKFN